MDYAATLQSFFTLGTYKIIFNQHEDVTVLQSFVKARVKDIDKIAERNEQGKMPVSYIAQFDHFRAVLNIDDIQRIKPVADGITIVYRAYEITFVKV